MPMSSQQQVVVTEIRKTPNIHGGVKLTPMRNQFMGSGKHKHKTFYLWPYKKKVLFEMGRNYFCVLRSFRGPYDRAG